MCLVKEDEMIPYDGTINPRNCFKCYHRNFYENFTVFPGVKCTIAQCVHYCEQEYESDEVESNCCCNTNPNYEPPCANCALLFWPCAFAIDIVTLPFRWIDRKCYIHQNQNSQKDIDKNTNDETKNKNTTQTSDTIQIEPTTDFEMTQQPKSSILNVLV
jgi:hypothetical protein